MNIEKLIMAKKDYRKFCKKMKGMKNVKWNNNNIFPIVNKSKLGPFVSYKLIHRAGLIAIKILEDEKDTIEKAFNNFAKKKYNGQSYNIKFYFQDAIERIKYATIVHPEGDVLGYNDYATIRICDLKFSNEELIALLLHESLHYLCTINDNGIGEKFEHQVMDTLGDY